MMPRSSGSCDRSTSVPGCARRSFIAATRLWPPASALPPLCANAVAASVSDFGRTSSKAYMVDSSLRACGVNGLPNAMWRRGHIEMADANLGQRIHDGVHHGGWRADSTRFAAALRAEWVVRAGSDGLRDLERRQIVSARHGVVHVTAREQLSALAVVDAVLEQRLSDALRDSTVDLSLDDHRIDHVAEVITCGECDDGHRARLRIDLDLADVRARGEGKIRRIVERSLLETRLEFVER